MTNIIEIQKEVKTELANKEVLNALVATTFKGLEPEIIPQAIVEGRIRGFLFQDFLQKNIYAIPFGKSYSLVTSIDYARKIGMRSDVVGKSEPSYEMDEKKIVACSVTIKRKVAGEVGEFTSKVYFDEYTTGRGTWTSKPRTMIAKVAEMHALRMACPEQMSQVYVEEEMEKEVVGVAKTVDFSEYEAKLKEAKTVEELRTTWNSLPGEAKKKFEGVKEEVKKKLTTK